MLRLKYVAGTTAHWINVIKTYKGNETGTVTRDIDVGDVSEEHQDIITEVIAIQDLKQWRKGCISSKSG